MGYVSDLICGGALSYYVFGKKDAKHLGRGKFFCCLSLWLCSCCCIPDNLTLFCCSNSIFSYFSTITIIIMTTFLVCVIVLSFIREPSIESFVIQYSVYSIIVFVLIAFGMEMSGWKERIQFEKQKKGLLSFQFGQSNFVK